MLSFLYAQPNLLNSSYLDDLRRWGFNAVRTGVQWSGVQPDGPSTVNQTYLDISSQIVQSLGEHNLYTLVEFHQDVLSTKYCLYDAIPLWVTELQETEHEWPWPLNPDVAMCNG